MRISDWSSDVCSSDLVGGGIANTFIAAEGFGVGKSLFEADLVDTAKQIMADAKARGADIPVPIDVVVAPEFKADAPATVKPVDAISADDMVLDIGPRSDEHTSELQSLMRIPYAGFGLIKQHKKKSR